VRACRPYFGVLKGTELKSKDDATRFIDQLMRHDVLKQVAERLEKKAGQKWGNTRQSLALGPKAHAVLDGSLPVQWTVQV
jgi:hypothetical protein